MKLPAIHPCFLEIHNFKAMKALDQELTRQISWFLDGRILRKEEWICTSYMNKGQKRNLENPQFSKHELEIYLSQDLFIQIFSEVYSPFVQGEQEEEPYEWGQFESFDKLRKINYPKVEDLYLKHPKLLAELLLELQSDFSDSIYLDRGIDMVHSYYLHLWHGCEISEDGVKIKGLALGMKK